MCLTGLLTTKCYPLFNRLVFLPSIIASQNFDTWKTRSVEDFILFVQKSNSVLRSLVFVNEFFNLWDESLVLFDVLMLLDHVCMTSWESLDVIKILLMSLLVDPGILNLDFLWLKSLMLFFSQQRVWITNSFIRSSIVILLSCLHESIRSCLC